MDSPPPRFATATVPVDDGWPRLEEEHVSVATEVRSENARTIITRNQSPDVPFSASINPYRGCEHGCIYCYARPTHSYLDLSPGIDFETKLTAKDNAPDVLADSLRKRGYRPEPITLGANTDAYQPIERERRLTRRILEAMLEASHPVSIITKSSLVLRDLDLLSTLAEHSLAEVHISLTTLDEGLARTLEPRAASPSARLKVIRALSGAGVPVGAMAAPIIPAINDHEVENLVAEAAGAGASACSYVLLRLPHEVAALFEAWLEQHFPERKTKALRLVREARGGALYDPRFETRMRGTGNYAELLSRRFELARQRYDLDDQLPPLSTVKFRRPAGSGDQLDLFRAT